MPSPFTVYFRRVLKALNLHKKTEYTARIAPAQLGKATVNRYRKTCSGRLGLLFGTGFISGHGYPCEHHLFVTWLLSPVAVCRSALATNNNKVGCY